MGRRRARALHPLLRARGRDHLGCDRPHPLRPPVGGAGDGAMKAPVLEEGPFTLRLPSAEDVSWIFHACQDEDIQRFTLIPTPYRPADAVAFIAFADECCAAGTALHFVVARTETGELLGAASLDLTQGDGVGELGYWVERWSRRQGVGRAAIA